MAGACESADERRRYDAGSGALAEWLGTGLQNLVRRFKSGRRLLET